GHFLYKGVPLSRYPRIPSLVALGPSCPTSAPEATGRMSERIAKLATITALSRACRMLAERLAPPEGRVQSGDEAAWSAYVETIRTLALLLPTLAPDHRGELLTTAEMAARIGIKPKTLLRRKARGEIKPAMQAGKLIRWKGSETL